MSSYRRVLAAVDITGESRQVAAAAGGIAGALDAELHILHVIETTVVPLGADFLPDVVASLTAQLRAQAQSHLGDIASEFAVPEERRHLVTEGRAAAQIRRVAELNEADLIVVGSHGRHGLGLLLGSTANGVCTPVLCMTLRRYTSTVRGLIPNSNATTCPTWCGWPSSPASIRSEGAPGQSGSRSRGGRRPVPTNVRDVVLLPGIGQMDAAGGAGADRCGADLVPRWALIRLVSPPGTRTASGP